jgi:hypothetical protein
MFAEICRLIEEANQTLLTAAFGGKADLERAMVSELDL